VIEVRRSLTDPSTASQEELGVILSEMGALPAFEGARPTLEGFLDLARVLQGPLAPLFPAEGGPAGEGATREALLARALLANPAVRPIFTRPPADPRARARAEGRAEAGIIHTRAAARVRGIDSQGGDAGVAAEEPINVSGFAVDPLAAGGAVLTALASGFPGLDAYAASGSYSMPLFAAAGLVRPPEAPALPRPSAHVLAARLRQRGFEVLGAHESGALPDAVEALLRQAQAAVGFYFSGAAAALVAAQVGGAVDGAPGASPELLAALRPVAPVLSDEGGLLAEPAAVAGPTWRGADAAASLRYLLGRLAKTEPVAADSPGTWAYDLSPLADLFRVGALGVYLFALTEGRESSHLDDFLELAAIRRAKAAKLAEISRRAVVATARARAYVMIIEDKFGSPRARAVLDALRETVGSRARGAPGGSLALPSDSVQVDDPGAVLALLSGRERGVVETEYDNRRKEWEASVGNKCPHVRLARRLRAATSAAEALAALAALAVYFVPPRQEGPRGRAPGRRGAPQGAEEWHMCRNCGFRALCPHVADRVRLEARRAPYDEIRTRLLKYAVRVREAGGDATHYFCRLCSEQLAEATEEDRAAERLGRFGELDAGLRAKVWVAALAAAGRIRFPAPTDEREFASTATDVVFPVLLAAEEAVAKKGRRRRAVPGRGDGGPGPGEEAQVDPRTQLYIVLFVYAYVLDLIRATQGARAQEVGFEGVKAGARESAYADRMLRLIAEEHRGLISQIEDITPDFLKARFVEAYRLVRGEGVAGLRVVNPEEELAVQTTTIDPIYRYAVAVARVAGDLPFARPAAPAEARREFETVLGVGLAGIVRLARENLRDPALAPLYLRRTGVEVPAGGVLDFLLKGPRVSLYPRLYEPGPGAAGAEALAAFRALAPPPGRPPVPGIRFWIGGRRGRAPARAAPGRARGPAAWARPEAPLAAAERGCYFESYRLFAAYTKEVISAEALAAYLEALAEFRRAEDGLRVQRALESVKSYYDFGFQDSQQFKPVDVPITALYDEDGLRHDWDRRVGYVFSTPSGAEVVVDCAGCGPGELTRARVVRARDSGALTPDMVLTDLVCPVCGTRASAVGALDVGKTERSLRAADEIRSFFGFYESRCPAGADRALHDWKGRACARCGLDEDTVEEVAAGRAVKSKRARAFYDRFAAQFARDRRAVTGAVPPPTAPPSTPRAEVAAPVLAEAEAWKPDYTLVVRAAELAGVSPATIEAIGDTAGREYADVTEGRGVPPPPTAPSDPRLYAADAEVRLFLADYSTLRHAARLVKPPVAISEILAAAGVPKADLPDLPQHLPDVGPGYRALFEALSRRAPADAYTYAIQSLCRMALAVAGVGGEGSPEWLARLGRAFATHELALILRGQKLFARPGTFSWAVFETGEEGAETQDQAGDVGEDVLGEILEAEALGEEAADNPFSGDHADIDFSEDNPNLEPD
jgi:hypothetical protein